MTWRSQSRRAGHFEHVAHMTVIDGDSPTLRIPAKIALWTVEEADPTGLREKKINASDPAREVDICSKLMEQVQQDVHLIDGKERNRPENSTTSRSSTKTRKNSRGRREENVNRTQKDDQEDVEWTKAKEKVEVFLDFPGFVAAMEYRNQSKAHGSSERSSKNGGRRGQPDSIPNTRHNANFLRDHEKAAEAILLNSRSQKNKRPQAVDSPGSTMKPRNQGAKMVEKPSSLVDSIAPEADTGTER
ncbi:uncharacterized protein [Dendrobates tinctorius]|uniref:uncharacterized protein isoform X2 n=1 Tax=Dendrobates tinctorius TaxID=92724 RepID=UPI003CC9CD71